MNLAANIESRHPTDIFSGKVPLEIKAGRFLIKTIMSKDDLRLALLLRYQVFQVEIVGLENNCQEDFDEFDAGCDHLAVFDTSTNQMVATCRLNSSIFSTKFYSETEFHCATLLNRPEIKLEIGRVCVHKDFRKSITIMLLWKAIAQYMILTETKILFGCGSVMTQDPKEALLIYRFLQEGNKVRSNYEIHPTKKYQSIEFNNLLQAQGLEPLSIAESKLACDLLPSLCRSYFDIGCFIPGTPAFDRDFKCIDFLTILESHELHPRILQKVLG